MAGGPMLAAAIKYTVAAHVQYSESMQAETRYLPAND